MGPVPEPPSRATEQPDDGDLAEGELEISDLRAPDHAISRAPGQRVDAQSGMPVAWYRQPVIVPRWLLSACVLALLLLFVVNLIPNFGGQLLGVIAPTPTASPFVFAQASVVTPAPTPFPTPTLVPPTLGSAPADCRPSTGAPHVGGFPNKLTYAVGGPDVWVDGFDSAHAATSITRDATGPYTQWGWPVAIALVLRDPFHATVTVVGQDTRTNSPLWWAFPANDGSTVLAPIFTIDPQQMTSSSADSVSKWWNGTLYLPGAGCYTLKANWSGGSWTATFAAGH